jgi:Sulfotransferase domain
MHHDVVAAYDRHNSKVRRTVPPRRLLEWRASEGWGRPVGRWMWECLKCGFRTLMEGDETDRTDRLAH